MTDHLSDEQIAASLMEAPPEDAARHLANCAACAAEFEALRGALAGFQAAQHAAAERGDFYWSRQRAGIAQRLQQQERSGVLRWAWASAAAVLALGFVLLSHNPQPGLRVATAQDPDDVLLMQVEEALNSHAPEALAPASLITAERNRITQASLKQINH
jgi:hypothetical protein